MLILTKALDSLMFFYAHFYLTKQAEQYFNY